MAKRQLNHLDELEAESIHIMREVVATFSKPVMLYSAGKDSSVLVRLAQKAFHPAPPPFPLLHVDTTWKFPEMYEFRDRMARRPERSLSSTSMRKDLLKASDRSPTDRRFTPT